MAAPNPARGSVRLAIDLARDASDLAITIVDVRGRIVRSEVLGAHAAGRHGWTWDGRDAHGQKAPAGLYFARVTADGATDARRLVLVP